MKMIKKTIDLHTHSRFSDGSMTPDELLHHAAEMQVSAIALTDHDTVSGLDEADIAARKYGVELVPGVEVSTESVSQIHMIGLYVDRHNKDLLGMFAELQKERKESNRKYLEKLRENGFPIEQSEVDALAPLGGVGRAHYARIMMNHGWVSSVKEAFAKYLAVGMPCYVKREVVSPEYAIEIIHKAGGLAFFAHPHQTKLAFGEIYNLASHLRDCGLDGMEGYYSEYTPFMHEAFSAMAESLGLLIGGGSDFHAMMKPHIEIGSGIGGNLSISYSVLEKIKAKLK